VKANAQRAFCRNYNAPTGSFFNNLKNERVHRTRCSTRAEAEADLFDHIERYTTGNGATPCSATPRQSNSSRPWSLISLSMNWRHNPAGFEDEKQMAAHITCCRSEQ
jgi:Integrase core domain